MLQTTITPPSNENQRNVLQRHGKKISALRNGDAGVKIVNANADWVRSRRITYARESC